MLNTAGKTDVFVVGGGPAGLAAAITARNCGFAVMLADAAQPPIDKACGEGIMPDGVASLRKLGVSIRPNAAVPFQGIRFSDGASAVQARFARGCGLGVRRTTLHQVLISTAAEVGVDMHWGARVSGLTSDGVTMDGCEVRCRWLVGADGQNSRVRDWAGLESVRSRTSQRFGFRRHYRIAPWSEFVEVDWTGHGQLYITPTGPEEVCVAFLTHDPRARLEDAFNSFPQIRSRLQGVPCITREQGAISPMRSLRRVYRGSRVLIGEASGSVDAITGEGLSIIFQQAHALAQALVRNNLSEYQTEHRRIGRLPRVMANLMLRMDRSPWLRARALHALQANPLLFTRMLAIHTGALSPFALGVQDTLAFGWHLVSA